MRGMTTVLVLLSTLACLDYQAINAQQTDSQQPQPCNSCCQGPVGSQGTPGIPGIPGTNGMPGNVGPKGEQGEGIMGGAGQHGEKGDIGNPGLKGESGPTGIRGPPGKVGPAGIPGPTGYPGLPGVKGQKGEMGQSHLSAFSATRSSTFTISSNGVALPFEQIHTNVGDDFDSASGRFTCEIPGIYLFVYNIGTNKYQPLVQLMKNDVLINSAYRYQENRLDLVSNSAVLQLATGDEVWLKCTNLGHKIYSIETYHLTTFSGVIIHEV